MLKDILSITGKPGLYKILSSNKHTLLVEDLVSKNVFRSASATAWYALEIFPCIL